VCKMVKTNEKERLSAKEALNHPWFKMKISTGNLSLAQKQMVNRRGTKLFERISVRTITDELLIYGLDSPSDLK